MEESFDVIKFKMNSHQQNVETIKSRIVNNNASIANIGAELKVLDDAKNILTILKNYKMESKKDFILKTINTALHDVFDQNLRIDIEATSATSTGKINMRYDIVLYQNEIEMARNEKLLGNNGGGVLSFVSILFKILVGYIYSDNKFFLFDESISQVSPLYRPRLAQFLKKFCAEYGFTLVLISQTDDVDEYADVGYLLDGTFDKDGVPTLSIDKVFGEYPTDKYTYVKIKNFQSIVDLEFRYKGLTIIRGNNNIGKSASFRAVNSLLFNTFDAKDHPRKKRPRATDVTILFGREDSTSPVTDNKIGLRYKGNKVIYEFNDLTFAGKSLAFEKVKEKVESIGFKYVNLKETYKNFKGNLKDQTERLAMTSQHDGFYLVGGKASETEKVFNFLFDSTDVANAIATCSTDILEKNKTLNLLTDEVKFETDNLKKEEVLYSIYVYKFYYVMITEHLTAINSLKHYNDKKLLITNYLADMANYTLIKQGLYNISYYNNELVRLNNNNAKARSIIITDLITNIQINESLKKFILDKSILNIHTNRKNVLLRTKEKYDQIIAVISEISSYRYYLDAFAKYFKDVNTLHQLRANNITSQKLVIVKDILDNVLFVKDFKRNLVALEDVKYRLETYKEYHYDKLNSLSNLDKEYDIVECHCCQGTGYIHGRV